MRIVFASHTERNAVLTVGSHHLSRTLANAGHQVEHVSTPISPANIIKIRDSRTRYRFNLARHPRNFGVPNLVESIPFSLVPPQLFPSLSLLSWQTTLLPSPRYWRALRQSRIDVLFVDQPFMAGLVDYLQPTQTIYRPTDIHPGKRLRIFEDHILRRIDGLIATSAPLLATYAGRVDAGIPQTVITNGVDFDRFHQSNEGPRNGAVYVGAIDDRFDWDWIVAAARMEPRVKMSLYGPVTSSPPCLPSNVHVLGPIAYRRVPDVLAASQVGLFPFKSGPVNTARSPMKLYEYLAAGLTIAASSHVDPRIEKLSAVHIDKGIEGSSLSTALRSPITQADIEAARSQDWSIKARELLHFSSTVK